MNTLLLAFWIVIGVLAGALANGAKMHPLAWGRRGWLYMLVVGASSALVEGWIATLLLGLQFAAMMALWTAVVGMVVFPWGANKYETFRMLANGHMEGDRKSLPLRPPFLPCLFLTFRITHVILAMGASGCDGDHAGEPVRLHAGGSKRVPAQPAFRRVPRLK